MLVINEPVWVEIPHEPNEKFALKRLSWVQLKDAAAVESAAQRENLKQLGGPLVGAIMAATDKDNKDDEATKQEKIRAASKAFQFNESQYGTAEILAMGIVGWTYDQDFDTKLLSKLDARTAVWAKQAIIDLTAGEQEEDGTKND